MPNAYTQENTASRQRLLALAARLTDDELSRPVGGGWTVSGLLAHLAFWDQRAVLLLRKWRQEGIGPSAIDVDVVNEAMREHCLAILPRAAAQLAVDAATTIDAEIEQLAGTMLAEVETNGTTVRLNRALHRREHLGPIEQVLGMYPSMHAH
jgi:uncharacterized damage-inducible protein DinB